MSDITEIVEKIPRTSVLIGIIILGIIIIIIDMMTHSNSGISVDTSMWQIAGILTIISGIVMSTMISKRCKIKND